MAQDDKKQDKANPESAEAAEAAARDAQNDMAEDAPITGDEPLVDLSGLESAAALSPDEDPVTVLEGEVASLKDQLLRAMAETENIRRRSQREREDSVKYAAVPVIRDLLGVADNLQRALESVPEEMAAESEVMSNLRLGVQMTQKELMSVFERHQIRAIAPLGEKLDPHLHEAMFELEDPEKPAGTVVQVIQTGYRLHDRLLRPARVGISKGGPKEGAAKAEGDASNDDTPGNDGPGSKVDTSA
ncbi:nucleotide exchange factor GrpE [Pelagibius litoralis]|uniref:Protein GrpE n=1 Tax=Pelagibius litoralis TaxID=374515 RepID=A0A967F2I8_9PROT|nr:nucleotide exchange factor GrpE [Pelagibius litoralis]NIA71996.1 nucleotide exchange factor GrpE [Pelagibius litoralis]